MTEYVAVLETARKVFIYSNNRNWDGLANDILADEILTDDSSYPGAPPAKLISKHELISWLQGAYAKITGAHHQVSNEIIHIEGNTAHANVYVTATHYKIENGNLTKWVVFSTFDINLSKDNNSWKVNQLKQNFKFEEGNPGMVFS